MGKWQLGVGAMEDRQYGNGGIAVWEWGNCSMGMED